ncbi:hypothetical protein RUND412_003149 [Rhizina undulata]
MFPESIECEHSFGSVPCCERKRSISIGDARAKWAQIALAPLYVGAAANVIDKNTVHIGISINDGTYSIDFCVNKIRIKEGESMEEAVTHDILDMIEKFSNEHHAKFVGAGITTALAEICPGMSALLWRELDIVVMKFKVESRIPCFGEAGFDSTECMKDSDWVVRDVDEQADSAVRKAIMCIGPHHSPALSIGFRNKVEVDHAGRISLVSSLDEYKNTVSEGTWNSVMKYGQDLKNCRVKIAYFSATPQGGGVALMRHACIRFFSLYGVQAAWYVPKPNPKVFRITKTNHNILQGVADPKARFDEDKQSQLTDWITYNAQRYWLSQGGPLSKGGADVVVIDDPQMPGLIPLIREARPDVKIIYRSHIEIRSDLAAIPGSPQEQVWQWLWKRIKLADVFISHPVDKFVPRDVPMPMVGLMPACTDWLDGLNKNMHDWDLRYYHHHFRNACADIGMNQLQYPLRDYITQIARFDPSKGIPDVIESYRKLRKRMAEDSPEMTTPQLLICGHEAIDDPDASIIFDEVMTQLDREEYDAIRSDVVVMRIGPSDQMLNALLSCAKVVLQLSSREGFEVKVSEALHKGKPVIASRAGGIPLQVQHTKNAFLVHVGDSTAVANYLYDLFTNNKLYCKMSAYAKVSVSDEVSTVGNVACWMYLASMLSKGEVLKPNARWITDMYREDAGQPYGPDEPMLPRG